VFDMIEQRATKLYLAVFWTFHSCKAL